MTTTLRQDSFPWKAMHLAVRPQGTTHLDFPRMTNKDHLKAMGRLVVRGICTRKRIDGLYYYYATTEQLQEYKSPKMGRPPSPTQQKTAKVLQQKVNISFCQPKPRPASSAALDHFKASDAIYPVDEQGRPLYKITVAPPPPPVTRTNTYSGAY